MWSHKKVKTTDQIRCIICNNKAKKEIGTMYYVPDGTKKCGYYECKKCGNRFLSLQTMEKIPCPDCEAEIDYEIGPDESMEDILDTAQLLQKIEGEEEVEKIAAIIETGRQEYQFMNDTQDNKWDKLLHIKTMGRDDSQSDQYRYPYEPTPYSVLQRLANTGLIRKNNMLLDYGCGKGRVDFFLSYQTRCRCLGVEYDERIYEKVMENKKEAISKERVSFSLANAEEFQLPEQIDRIYFFNPFSVEILRKSYISDDGG